MDAADLSSLSSACARIRDAPSLLYRDEMAFFRTFVSDVSEGKVSSSLEEDFASLTACLARDDDDSALTHCESILSRHPSARVYTRRAEVQSRRGDVEGALESCRLALTLNSDYAPALRCRGKAFLRSGDAGSAKRDLDTAQAIDFDESLCDTISEITAQLAHTPSSNEEEKEKKENEKKVEEEEEEEEPPAEEAAGRGPDPVPTRRGEEKTDTGDIEAMMKQFLSNPDILSALNNPSIMNAAKDVLSSSGGMEDLLGKVMKG